MRWQSVLDGQDRCPVLRSGFDSHHGYLSLSLTAIHEDWQTWSYSVLFSPPLTASLIFTRVRGFCGLTGFVPLCLAFSLLRYSALSASVRDWKNWICLSGSADTFGPQRTTHQICHKPRQLSVSASQWNAAASSRQKLRCTTSKAAGASARISTFVQSCVLITDSLVYDVQ